MSEALRLRLAMNVIRLRHTQNVSQAQLASSAGLHRSYIGSIEQARRNVSIDNIGVIAHALGVDAQLLLAPVPMLLVATPASESSPRPCRP